MCVLSEMIMCFNLHAHASKLTQLQQYINKINSEREINLNAADPYSQRRYCRDDYGCYFRRHKGSSSKVGVPLVVMAKPGGCCHMSLVLVCGLNNAIMFITCKLTLSSGTSTLLQSSLQVAAFALLQYWSNIFFIHKDDWNVCWKHNTARIKWKPPVHFVLQVSHSNIHLACWESGWWNKTSTQQTDGYVRVWSNCPTLLWSTPSPSSSWCPHCGWGLHSTQLLQLCWHSWWLFENSSVKEPDL